MTYLSPHRCRGAARGYAASWVNSREQGRVNSRERLSLSAFRVLAFVEFGFDA